MGGRKNPVIIFWGFWDSTPHSGPGEADRAGNLLPSSSGACDSVQWVVSQAADFLQTLSVDTRVALVRSVNVENDSGSSARLTYMRWTRWREQWEKHLLCSTLLYYNSNSEPERLCHGPKL